MLLSRLTGGDCPARQYTEHTQKKTKIVKLCWSHHNMLPPLSSICGRLAPPNRPQLRSNGEYVPTVTAAAAWCVNAVVSKAAWWPWPLTLKVVSESRVTLATSVPILVFPKGISVLDLGPMYATDRQTSDSMHRLMPPPIRGGGIINMQVVWYSK